MDYSAKGLYSSSLSQKLQSLPSPIVPGALTIKTGTRDARRIRSAMLPLTHRLTPDRPCVAIKIIMNPFLRIHFADTILQLQGLPFGNFHTPCPPDNFSGSFHA
jgi:hypothetical protein